MNTDVLSHIHWLAVLVAGVAYFMLGGLWYSKALFGTKWASLQKIDMTSADAKKGMGAMMFYSLVLMILTSIGMAILVVKMDITVASAGAKLGLLTGLLFAVTSVCITFLYEKKPLALHIITGAYLLIGNVIVAVILAVWR